MKSKYYNLFTYKIICLLSTYLATTYYYYLLSIYQCYRSSVVRNIIKDICLIRIWLHLSDLSSEGKTIIITTHYIEEARRAHTVGMMRSGIILSEDAPENLLKCYGCSTLEDVFLKLCVIDTSKVIQVNNLFSPGLELRSSTCKIYFLMLPTYYTYDVPTYL